MFTSNPFADLTDFLSPLVMQAYIVSGQLQKLK